MILIKIFIDRRSNLVKSLPLSAKIVRLFYHSTTTKSRRFVRKKTDFAIRIKSAWNVQSNDTTSATTLHGKTQYSSQHWSALNVQDYGLLYCSMYLYSEYHRQLYGHHVSYLKLFFYILDTGIVHQNQDYVCCDTGRSQGPNKYYSAIPPVFPFFSQRIRPSRDNLITHTQASLFASYFGHLTSHLSPVYSPWLNRLWECSTLGITWLGHDPANQTRFKGQHLCAPLRSSRDSPSSSANQIPSKGQRDTPLMGHVRYGTNRPITVPEKVSGGVRLARSLKHVYEHDMVWLV